MKILCFADTHVGVKTYGKIDKNTGLNEREVQTIDLLNQIVDYAINERIDVVVFSGDMYHKNLPTPTLINKVNEALIKLSKYKIQTYIADGNHDVSKMESQDSGLAQFNTLNIPYIVHSRFYKECLFDCDNDTYRFVILPTYHTKDDIKQYMDSLDSKYKTFVIFHGCINNAQLNDWNTVDSETCIDKEMFVKNKVLGVIAGHFHKAQILEKKPLIFYVGSTNRIDFSEEKQKKGFVVLDVNHDNVEYTFHELDAQKFLTVNINCENVTSPTDIENEILNQLKKHNLNHAILRIRVKLTENVNIDEKKILEYAYNCNVYYMLKIQKQLPDVKTIIDDSISNTLSVFESLKQYYKGQKREKERISLAKEIVEEVEECT